MHPTADKLRTEVGGVGLGSRAADANDGNGGSSAQLHPPTTPPSGGHATMLAWGAWDEEQEQTPEEQWAVYDNVYAGRNDNRSTSDA